jgi:5'-nucleotidase
MGQDLVISGTVAAAREAAYHGVTAFALSHYLIKDVPLDWGRTSIWATEILSALLQQSLAAGEFWNVNLPHPDTHVTELPDLVLVPPAREPLPVGYSSEKDAAGRTLLRYDVHYANRPAPPLTDVGICFSGRVSISRLRMAADE